MTSGCPVPVTDKNDTGSDLFNLIRNTVFKDKFSLTEKNEINKNNKRMQISLFY